MQDLFSALVSFGLPSADDKNDGSYARFAVFENSRLSVPLKLRNMEKAQSPYLYAYFGPGASDTDFVDGMRLTKPECERVRDFYLKTVSETARVLDRYRFARVVEMLLVNAGIGESALAKVNDALLLTVERIQSSRQIDSFLSLGGTDESACALEVIRSCSGQLDVSNAENSDFVSENLSHIRTKSLVPSGLIVLSEYAFPAFSTETEGLSRDFIVDELTRIARQFEVYIHGGTLNDCFPNSGERGYAYGVFVAPGEMTQPKLIFKREHAMSGTRSDIVEGFVGHPAVANLDLFQTDFGYAGFPICADFISTQFDDVLGECVDDIDKPIDYLISPARDFSKGALFRKATAPLSRWNFTDIRVRQFLDNQPEPTSSTDEAAQDPDVPKTSTANPFPFYLGYVNCLEAACVGRQIEMSSAKIEELSDTFVEAIRDGANLQGFFRVNGPTEGDVHPCDELLASVFITQPASPTDLSAPEINRAKMSSAEAMDMWSDGRNRTSLAAYATVRRTATQRSKMNPPVDADRV